MIGKPDHVTKINEDGHVPFPHFSRRRFRRYIDFGESCIQQTRSDLLGGLAGRWFWPTCVALPLEPEPWYGGDRLSCDERDRDNFTPKTAGCEAWVMLVREYMFSNHSVRAELIFRLMKGFVFSSCFHVRLR